MRRVIAWTKEGPHGAELAEVELGADGLRATGVAIGADPVPYRLDYRLETGPGWVHRRLHAETRGAGWSRELELERAVTGAWSVRARGSGELALAAPGGDPAALAGALDCDLGLSPLLNTPPVLRHGLLRAGAPAAPDLVMAWVSVPDLAVRPSRQRYTALDAAGGRIVFAELDDAGAPAFTATLTYDAEGLVLDYPGIGRTPVV
jgi:hypothetical protein